MNKIKEYKLSFNAPVILTFSCISLIAFVLSFLTNGALNRIVFSVYRSSLLSPMTYVRLIGHVFGHTSWEHFLSNITIILLVGPLLEEKYGSPFILKVMGITALVTGIFHFVAMPGNMLLGASGIAFALILLASITGHKNREIPVTFLLIALIYIGGQIYEGIFIKDDVSNITHIIGGIIGACCGFGLKRVKN